MFRWWGKRDRSVASSARPTASEVDAEYSEYRSRIQKPMLQGVLVGGLGSALFTCLRGCRASRQRNRLPARSLRPRPRSFWLRFRRR